LNTMCKYKNMCNVKASTNKSSVIVVILIEDILKVMLFLHHHANVFA
jgi:hypothetical protein